MPFLMSIVILFVIVGSETCFSQEFNRKFGDVDKAQLNQKNDSLYPASEAAFLFDYGVATTSTLQRHVQIKIYKKEGIKWASMNIPGWGGLVNSDILKKVNAVCYNLEGGKVISTELDEDGIIRKRNSNEIEIQLLNVKEGSIVEFQYELETNRHEWYFQYTIPVYWSEFMILNPRNYVYQIFLKGSVPFYIYDSDYKGYTRYVVKDVAPFVLEEPVSSIHNHLAKVEYHLSKYLPNAKDTMNYAVTWYEVCQNLISSEKFGGCLDGGLYMNDLKNEILEKDSLEMSVMVLAHEKIKELMDWNKEYSVFTDFTLRNAFKTGIGNSADINLNLVLLLRKLGLEANPVVLATKDKGYLSQKKPGISNLNYVLAAVTINHRLFLLDATNPFLIIDMLPYHAQNDIGLFIDDKTSYWIEFDNQLPFKSFQMNTLELDSQGIFKGKVQISREMYAAYEFRNKYTLLVEDSIEYEKYLEKEYPGLKVVSSNLENFYELYKPLKEVYEIEINSKTIISDGMISFNPMFYNQISDNPFELESRSYPVEYSYKQDKFYILNLRLPDGFQVESIPEDFIATLPDNNASFEFRTDISENQIQITSHLKINRLVFQAEEYHDLKKFFDFVVSKHAELVELKKNDSDKY